MIPKTFLDFVQQGRWEEQSNADSYYKTQYALKESVQPAAPLLR